MRPVEGGARVRAMARSYRGAVAATAILFAIVGCGSKAANPDNELPFGWMDQPSSGAVITDGKVVASGWALDDSAIKEIRLYVDSRLKAVTSVTIARDDLKGPHPAYMHDTNIHGWTAEVDLSGSPGMHTLLAQAEDDQGATHDLTSVAITVPPAK